jgi:hypothetical protein
MLYFLPFQGEFVHGFSAGGTNKTLSKYLKRPELRSPSIQSRSKSWVMVFRSEQNAIVANQKCPPSEPRKAGQLSDSSSPID